MTGKLLTVFKRILEATELAETTKTAYLSTLKTVAEGVAPKAISTTFLKDTEAVIKFVNGKFTENGRRNVYGGMLNAKSSYHW